MRRHQKAGRASRQPSKRSLPTDYVCIAPEEALLVFDYLRGRKDVDERLVALHLHLCDRCQETVKNLKDIDEALKMALVTV